MPTWSGVLKDIAEAPRDYANGSLELASMTLEAWAAGLPIEQLRPVVVAWMESIKTRPGIYRRSPNNHEQSSHDEWLGLAVLSRMFNLQTAKEILDQGLILGLWMTGEPHSKIWGVGIDGEYFVNWRPGYRAYMKLAAKRPISSLEGWALNMNLANSTTFNLLRIRMLFLSYIGHDVPKRYTDRLGEKYRGRYGQHPIYLELWRLNHGNYAP